MKKFDSAVILAGGKSSRIGFDKQFLKINEKRLMNAIIVEIVFGFIYHVPYWFAIFTVGAGELISCYVLGYPLLLVLDKVKHKLFK